MSNEEGGISIKPYIYQSEANAARLERTIQRLWITTIVLILMLVATNGLWICYEMQYEEVVTTQEATVDTGSGNAYINNGGDMYGTSEGKADN